MWPAVVEVLATAAAISAIVAYSARRSSARHHPEVDEKTAGKGNPNFRSPIKLRVEGDGGVRFGSKPSGRWSTGKEKVKLSSVVLARVLRHTEAIDLNPRGTIFYPEFTQEFVERYKFQKFPQKLNRRVRRIEGRGVPSRKRSGALSYKHLLFGTAFWLLRPDQTQSIQSKFSKMHCFGVQASLVSTTSLE